VKHAHRLAHSDRRSRYNDAAARRIHNTNPTRALDIAELAAENGLCELTIPAGKQYAWAKDDCWAISAKVKPAEWPAWTDEVAFGVSAERIEKEVLP